MSLKQFGFQTSNYTTFPNNFSNFPLCITTLPWCPVAIVIDSFKGVFSNFDISLFDNLQQYSNTSTDKRFYACSNLKKNVLKQCSYYVQNAALWQIHTYYINWFVYTVIA